jgi:hypothetical protein
VSIPLFPNFPHYELSSHNPSDVSNWTTVREEKVEEGEKQILFKNQIFIRHR